MIDVEQQLKRALGEPPVDDHARRRALVRLRAEITEAISGSRNTRRTTLLRQATIAIAALLIVATALVTFSARRPAIATELQALATANDAWRADHGSPPVDIEATYMSVSSQLSGGPGFTINVQAEITRTVDSDGVPIEKTTILSSEFASATDQHIWEVMGSPPLDELDVGRTTTQRLDRIYNFDAISDDPMTLQQAIADGRVTGSGYDPTPGQQFGLIGSLLLQPELDRAQRTALYQVVGSLEGVKLMGDVVDPAGRSGVGFSRVVGSRTQILIFDRATGLPLAAEETPVDRSVISESLVFDPPS